MDEKKQRHNRDHYERRRNSIHNQNGTTRRRSGTKNAAGEQSRAASGTDGFNTMPSNVSEPAQKPLVSEDFWRELNTYDPRAKLRAWEEESGDELLPKEPDWVREEGGYTPTVQHAPTPTPRQRLPRGLWFAIAGTVLAVVLIIVISVLANHARQEERTAAATQSIIQQAQQQAAGYEYDAALATLNSATEYAERPEIIAAVDSVEQQKQSLVKYEGPVYHIFFHSLIVDPSKAFDGDYKTWDYNMYYVTSDEFKRILPELEANGFVLYPLEETVDIASDGTMTQRDIYLPEGKKPLVLSIDDVAYYEYMEPDGFASRLVVDEDGRLATLVQDDSGELRQTYDGDVMPIVDQYVAEHPEFSWHGAKGIVAVTGYEGAFGYRITDLEGDALTEAQNDVREVANCLRDSGWCIANHSYTHNGYFMDYTVTMELLADDMERWKSLIEPYVGETDIYISPYGVYFGEDDERQQYIYDQGYRFFCPVGNDTGLKLYDNHLVQYRYNIDGYSMQKRPDLVVTYFDPAVVLDDCRPAL